MQFCVSLNILWHCPSFGLEGKVTFSSPVATVEFSTYLMVKKIICLQCGRPRFDPWVGKILWRRKWQSTPGLLPGKSHGQSSLVGYSPWGHKELDTTVRLSLSLSSSFSKSSLNIWKFSVHILLKPSLENFEHYFASM